MNTSSPPPMNMNAPRWYYMGQDDKEHGPFESSRMIIWSKSGYFDEMLMVRTENDSKYYPLAEWTRLCANQLPFVFPIFSYDNLLNDRLNAISLIQQHGQQPPPPAPTVPTPMHLFNPVSIAPPPAPQGAIMVSFPAGIPPPPPPPNAAQLFSPTQPLYFAAQQPPPTGFPHHPYMVTNGGSIYMGVGHNPEMEHPSSTVSNTPDSSTMTEIPHIDKKIDTFDAPWIKRVDQASSPINVGNKNSIGTQTMPIKFSAEDAARLLSGMLNAPVEIIT